MIGRMLYRTHTGTGRDQMRIMARIILAITVVACCTTISHAQESSWEELTKKSIGMYRGGRYTEAIRIAHQALEATESTFGPDHPMVAKSLNNLAQMYTSRGEHEKAEPLFDRARTILGKTLGDDHPDTVPTLNNLAGLYMDLERYAQAESLYIKALSIREKHLSKDHPDVATSLNNHAVLFARQGRYAEAEPRYKRALTL